MPAGPRSDALAERLRRTLEAVEKGGVPLRGEGAAAELAYWIDRLDHPACAHLADVRQDLEALLALTSPEKPDAQGLGRALARLGERLGAAATRADPALQPTLSRLGDFLFHAGHALRGPIPSGSDHHHEQVLASAQPRPH